ncbi:disease resistance protein [Nicotiana attenuata]|uniref:Disease resistance protein n=1 Tax=Nicotiana attenuata TaxID=49451 RepID=A0A1J6IB47_NICAT|nr:disease resistance protein [Nicotiana attenuata]
MALQVITTVLEPIMDYIVKPIGRQLGYLISYRSNIQNLKVEMEKLNKLREDVEQSKEEVESNLEIVGDGVKDWLRNTTEIQKVTTTIFPSEADIGKGCLRQCLISRYVLSRKAKKMTNTVIHQRNDGRNYEKFTHLAPPVESWIRSKIDSDDGMSRQLVVANIIESLNDEEINMIAMWSRWCWQVENGRKSYCKEALGLKLDERSEMMRANKLKARLKMKNKILLVLDDVWQKLDLEKIGIPLGKEHEGCKVIVTSRSHEVCSYLLLKGIKIFTIKSLSKKESWDLFRRNVGDRINDPVLNKIAQEIAKECGGLPLAILTVASTLKDKSQENWIGGLAQLRSVLPNNITGLGDVFKSLKLSYDHIESDEARKLYLHCCLFPEDYSIPLEILAIRGMSLGMFIDVNSLKEAKIRVNFLVYKLTNYFLLQKGKDDSSVIMHDAFRDIAIYITSREQHLFGINHDFKLKEWPRDIHHEEVTCISVRLTTTVKHPKTLNCPRLELLELETWKTSVSLHDGIFQGSRALKTIEISRMKFSLLPSSIGLLKNLRMLRLIDCEMENISMIGELVNLEILSLRYSRFTVFPAELRRLEKLKCWI